jgi:hypothetical protein
VYGGKGEMQVQEKCSIIAILDVMKKLLQVLLLVFILAVTLNAVSASNHTWISCLIITNQGDTMRTEIKSRKDFSDEGSLLPGNEVLLRQKDGSTVKLGIHTFRELIITDGRAGFNHYISLNINSRYPGQYRFYRVITEGGCKLLCSTVSGNAGKLATTSSAGDGMSQNFDTPMKPGQDEYDIYYNNKLTPVLVDDDLNLNPISKSNCADVLKACSTVVEAINNPKTKNLNLNQLIEMFNTCGFK